MTTVKCGATIIAEQEEKREKPLSVGTEDECFARFTRQWQCTVVVGAPGAGKSTWTKWLQRRAVDSSWPGIAVRVELRRFSGRSLPSRNDLVREVAGKHMTEALTEDRIGRWLEAGWVIFILDGFDELRPDCRNDVYEWIVDLRSASRGCPFVLTSRPLTTDHLDRLDRPWQHWVMGPFDEERIVEYIERWYRYRPLLTDSEREVDAPKLASTWASDPTIAPLTGNPLLLSTILMVHHLDGTLPSGRSQLYRRYIDGMLGLWDSRRKVVATALDLTVNQRRRILRAIALQMFLQGKDQLDEPAMIDLARRVVRDVKLGVDVEHVLAELRERSGLIVGPGIYSFVHKTVTEYLVAETVLEGDQRDKSGNRLDRLWLLEHRDDDRWNGVVFFWAGLSRAAELEAFVDACIQSDCPDLAYGLVLDQYERIPRDVCRKLLLAGIPLISFELTDLPVKLSLPFDFDLDLKVSNFALRSVVKSGSGTGFFGLMDRCVRHRVINWTDSGRMQGRLRNLLWFLTIAHTESVEDWQDCLRSDFPADTPCEHWLFFALQSMLWVNRDLDLFIEGFREVHPESCGLVSLVLLSWVLGDSRQAPHSYANTVYQILDMLPTTDSDEVPADWLLRTSDLEGHAYNARVDLLAMFSSEVERLVQLGTLERNASLERAMTFVEDLKERREALLTQAGPFSPAPEPPAGKGKTS